RNLAIPCAPDPLIARARFSACWSAATIARDVKFQGTGIVYTTISLRRARADVRYRTWLRSALSLRLPVGSLARVPGGKQSDRSRHQRLKWRPRQPSGSIDPGLWSRTLRWRQKPFRPEMSDKQRIHAGQN